MNKGSTKTDLYTCFTEPILYIAYLFLVSFVLYSPWIKLNLDTVWLWNNSLTMMTACCLVTKYTIRVYYYSKTCLKRPLKHNTKIFFQYPLSLDAGQKYCIAEYSKGCILQYVRPSLIYNFPIRPLFCLFLSGRSRQVILYINGFREKLPVSIQSWAKASLLAKRHSLTGRCSGLFWAVY